MIYPNYIVENLRKRVYHLTSDDISCDKDILKMSQEAVLMESIDWNYGDGNSSYILKLITDCGLKLVSDES